jgi:hypothetical protein
MISTQYFSVDQVEKNELDGACSTYGGEERCIQDFGGGRDHLEESDLDERITLK